MQKTAFCSELKILAFVCCSKNQAGFAYISFEFVSTSHDIGTKLKEIEDSFFVFGLQTRLTHKKPGGRAA